MAWTSTTAMNDDGRTTSEQLYIPTVLVIGAEDALLLRCYHASRTTGLAIRTCLLVEATFEIPRRHPIAIVASSEIGERSSHDLVALAGDVRSSLLLVDPEVSVRELEAMFAAAVAGGLSQHERRGGAGRYSIVGGVEEEAPFSRRSAPPASRPSLSPASGPSLSSTSVSRLRLAVGDRR